MNQNAKRPFPAQVYEANLILFDNQVKIAKFDINKRTINLFFKNMNANIVFTVDANRIAPVPGSDRISVNLYAPHNYSVLFIDGAKNDKKSVVMCGAELIDYINKYNKIDYYTTYKSDLYGDIAKYDRDQRDQHPNR